MIKKNLENKPWKKKINKKIPTFNEKPEFPP